LKPKNENKRKFYINLYLKDGLGMEFTACVRYRTGNS